MIHRVSILLLLGAVALYALGYSTESGAVCFLGFILECKFWANVLRSRHETPPPNEHASGK